MMQSEQIDQLAKALSVAQGMMTGAKKDSANPFFKSKYADLESVWEACRIPLASNGLSVIQTIESDGIHSFLVSTLCHESGQWIKSKALLVSKDNSPQGYGSSISYFRRYCLAALVGIYQSDDDAETAQARKQETPKITHEQFSEIAQMLEGKEDIITQILTRLKIRRLGDIPADRFDGVMKFVKESVNAAANQSTQ